MVGRRDFITLAGAATVSGIWPLAVLAEQPERIRRIGMLVNLAEDDAHARARLAAFVEALRQLGWTEGRNVRIDVRWAAGDAGRLRRYAAELLALAPDLLLASGGSTVSPLLQATRSVPIVFAQLTDPVGAGVVESLSRPGGNVTGFATIDFGMSAKFLELLKEIAPRVTRAAVIRDATIAVGIGQFAAMQAVAPSLGVELSPIGVRDGGAIERAVAEFARSPNGGLIVAASGLAFTHRELIIGLAARHRLPAVYFNRSFVVAGGLISYGVDAVATHRLAAGYAHRILKGEKPANLPVQAPTKFELVVNLKTAKALGVKIPETLLVAANEVIE